MLQGHLPLRSNSPWRAPVTAVVHSPPMSVQAGTIGVVRLKACMAAYTHTTSGSMAADAAIPRVSSVHGEFLFVALRIDPLISAVICPDKYRD